MPFMDSAGEKATAHSCTLKGGCIWAFHGRAAPIILLVMT